MITLFVDASHCPESHAAGYGAWAIQDGWEKGKIYGGRISKEVTNSGEAEICGIVEAVKYLKANRMMEDNTMMIQSDSHRALQLVILALPHTQIKQHKDSKDWGMSNIMPTPAEQWAITQLTNDLGLMAFIYVRHIKGHSDGDGRNWVNRQCDRVAREQMYKQRQQRGYKLRKPKYHRDRERFKN